MIRALWIRLRGSFGKTGFERELAEELASHLELHVADNLRAGMPAGEARRNALLKLGGLEQTKQAMRERRGWPAIEAMAADLRFATRRLRKHPGFTAVAVMTLALGMGANSTIFAMVSRFVLHPAPVGDPGSLMTLHTTERNQCCNSFSWPLFAELREQSKTFLGLTGFYELLPASIGGDGDPERLWGQATTTNYFDVTKLKMAAGRGFLSDEQNLPVIVIGHRVWRGRFHSDPAIVGKAITVSGRPFTVVGVAPPYFRGLDLILDCEFWVPIGNIDFLLPGASHYDSRADHWIVVAGRLKPGAGADATAELAVLARRFAQDHPDTEKDLGFRFEQAGSLPPRDRRAILSFLGTLMAVVLLVLCIAGANVANLLLAQAAARQREMAVRVALGATRTHLLRQVLTESVLLSLAGGSAGLLLSVWATSGLSAFRFPAPVALDLSVGVDGNVLLFSFALSLVTGLLLGLVTASMAALGNTSRAMKGEDLLARPGKFWTLRNALVIAQISISLILLCATGLFLRSLRSAAGIDVGFRTREVVMMAIDPRLHGYTAERTTQFLSELERRVAALPGVLSAAVTDTVPLAGGSRRDGFAVAGHPSENPDNDPVVELYMASPGYFGTMGISLLAGRDFEGADSRIGAPKVAVVDQVFAEKLFPHQDPLGRQVSGGGATYEIIGVVNAIKSRTLGEEARPVLFRSLGQSAGSDPSFAGYSILARSRGDSAALATAIRGEIRALDPALAVFNEETMEKHLRAAMFLPRLAGTLFAVFGVAGLLLAAMGLYGVMSYVVALRKREVGIRMALGADAVAVQGLFLKQGTQLALAGVAIGLPAGLLVARLFRGLLYGVRPQDLTTFVAVPLFLTAVALLACWIPSRKAAKVEPASALRFE